MKKMAIMVRHHDKPACKARLDDKGFCPECKVYPNPQNIRSVPYCPTCVRPLSNLKCPRCKQTFDAPN